MKLKKILLRGDGNTATGLGHLYRLFALFEVLKNDYECILLTKSNSTLSIVPKQYKVLMIDDNITINKEPEWISKNFSSETYAIIIDGYHFNQTYLEALKIKQYKTVYIDDLAIEHMYADLVINHSPAAFTQPYSAEAYTRFALGTDFAMVRPIFLAAAKQPRYIGKLKTAFVSFGGSDTLNLSYKVCHVLLNLNQIKKINLVLGEANQNKEIYELKEKFSQIEIFKNLGESELLEVMKSSDFAIVPTSTLLFELCCIKMPILSGYYVDNQFLAYHSFIEQGVITGVDNFTEISDKDLESKILGLLNSDVNSILKIQSKLFDGNQKARLLETINKL